MIKCLYEHESCYNYDKTGYRLVNLLQAEENFFDEALLTSHLILYVLKGQIELCGEELEKVTLTERQMFFVSIGAEFTYTLTKEAACLIFKLPDEIKLCECYHVSSLREEIPTFENYTPFLLEANEPIVAYMKNVQFLIQQKLFCRILLSLKVTELLYLLRVFYAKKDLALFFYTGLFDNATFTCEVIRNYRRCNTIADLAGLMNYTVSGFEKRFKKNFGVSPAKWIRDRKSKYIYKDVCRGVLNFKEIADKYNFASTSTFNDFYKLTFGETPGITRKKMNPGIK